MFKEVLILNFCLRFSLMIRKYENKLPYIGEEEERGEKFWQCGTKRSWLMVDFTVKFQFFLLILVCLLTIQTLESRLCLQIIIVDDNNIFQMSQVSSKTVVYNSMHALEYISSMNML